MVREVWVGGWKVGVRDGVLEIRLSKGSSALHDPCAGGAVAVVSQLDLSW